MPRPRSYVIRNGKTIDGVSYHVEGGYYIIKDGRRQYFGKSDADLARAKAAYDGQHRPPLHVPTMTPEQAAEAGIDDPDKLHEAMMPTRVNPEHFETTEQYTDYIGTKVLRIKPDKWERAKNPPLVVNPKGKQITVSEVGQIYLRWYLIDKGGINLDECCRLAEAEKAKLQADLADLEERQEKPRGETVSKAIKRQGQSKKRAAKITALRRKLKHFSWVDMLPRKENRAYREQDKYFGEFASFIMGRHDHDLAIARLTGDDLRAYYDHVRILATSDKTLTAPDKWRNLRYQAVSTAFRRVKKIYPDAAYPQGFFGVDGTLSILECRKTTTEAEKVKLEPEEFRALLDVADTQWKAILYLSLNCALENESVSHICWEHIDFARKLMLFARPKNNRPRQTPLASQTINALNDWKAESKSNRPNIFTTPHGGDWLNGTDSLGKHFNILKDLVKQKTKATIEATFKALRKTSSSVVMQATKNETAVEMLLGHAPIKSWRHYVGFAPDFLHKGVKAIERQYFAAPETQGKVKGKDKKQEPKK